MGNNIFKYFDRELYKIGSGNFYNTPDNSINPDQISSGGASEQMQQYVGAISVGKQGFDNNETGYILGVDNGVAKFYIGNSTNYLNWTGTQVVVSGDILATSGKFGSETNYWSVGANGLTAVSTDADVVINYGKTDFGQDSTNGFILGYDYSASKPKFEIGSSTAKILKYDGTDFSLTGGTITGGIVQTASSGQRIVMSDNSLTAYSASATLFTLLVGSTEVVKYFSSGSKRAQTLFENINATADVIYIEMGAGSGRALNITDSGSNRTNEMVKIFTDNDTAVLVQGSNAIGKELVKFNQTDQDKTCLLITNGQVNAGHMGMLEIGTGSNSAIHSCLYMFASSGISHMSLEGSSVPSSPSPGDIWFNGTDLHIRVGGTTYTFDKTAV